MAHQVAPIFYYRSALPVNIRRGLDRNGDFVTTTFRTARSRSMASAAPRDIGACLTINCGRGAGASQLNLRVSQRFALAGPRGSTVIAEVFNLFNAGSPSAFNTRRVLLDPVQSQSVAQLRTSCSRRPCRRLSAARAAGVVSSP